MRDVFETQCGFGDLEGRIRNFDIIALKALIAVISLWRLATTFQIQIQKSLLNIKLSV